MLIAESKLVPEFLERCDTLERQFDALLTPSRTSLRCQFEDFLIENLYNVQHMTERQFLAFIVKQSTDGPYGDYVKHAYL